MKDKVYLFGAYFGTKIDGSQEIGNYIHEYKSMPSIDKIKNSLRIGSKDICAVTILTMQFLTKEQFLALKGIEEKPDEQQSELGE